MNSLDIEFLKNLQNEMLTQDTIGQASPRFWVVRNKVRTYGIDREYSYDGEAVIYDTETIGYNLKDIFNYLSDQDLPVAYCNESESIVIFGGTENEEIFYDLEDLVNYMRDDLDYNDLYISAYKDEWVIVENTMFLTLKECKEHIERNHYHYNEPRTYAMTAWRSPQIERLYEILENTDWDKLKGDK